MTLGVWDEGEASFKSALAEANLKLHMLRMKERPRPSRRTPRRPDTRTSAATPGLGGVTSLAERPDTIDDVSMIRTGKPRVVAAIPYPFHIEQDKMRTAEMTTINEKTSAKQNRRKLFKSKRYGDSYLVPSDVKRTCEGVAFDPSVLAVSQKEIEEIETRKRLSDITRKLRTQRENAGYLQEHVNMWVNSVDKQNKPRNSRLVKSKLGF